MTVEEKKERNRKYGAICARAKAMGIMQGDAISAIMDIESADRKFNLKETANRRLTGYYEDLYLKEGENTFSVSPGFTVKIKPNWRCR